MDLQGAIPVVSDYQVSDGNGEFSGFSLQYMGLKFDSLRKSLLGFKIISNVSQETGIRTSTFYKQDYPYTGLPYKSEVRLSNGTLVLERGHLEFCHDVPWGGVSICRGKR